MHSIKPSKSYPHPLFVELRTARIFKEYENPFLREVRTPEAYLIYTFVPKKKDPNYILSQDVNIENDIINVVDFPDKHFYSHYAVLFRVYSILSLIYNFKHVGESPVKYNDGWGTITIELEDDKIKVSYLDKWVKHIPFDLSVFIGDAKSWDDTLIDLLTQIKNDGYEAQEKMLLRDGSLDGFVFHIYPTMSGGECSSSRIQNNYI